MCANSPADSVTEESTETGRPGSIERELPPKAGQLGAYLDSKLEAESEIYVKSRFVAAEIDLSAKAIGWYLGQLQDSDTSVTVESWAYSNGTTWRITTV